MGNVTVLGRGSDHGDVYNIIDAQVINALGEYVSNAISLVKRSEFGLWYEATSVTGVPLVRIFVDTSPDLDEDHFVVPSGLSDLETALTDLSGIVVQYIGSEASAKVTVADLKGITIQYTGNAATGTVEVIENAIILCAPAGSEMFRYDLTAAAYDTIAELVAVIDALPDWTCTQHANMVGTEKSIHLKIIGATSCKTGTEFGIDLAMDRCIYGEAPTGTADANFGPAGKIFLRDTAKDTIAELVAYIDGLDYWTCTKHADMAGHEASRLLKLLVATACKAGTINLAIELPRMKSVSLSPMRYMRVRAQGVSINPVDTVVTAKLFVQ
jgi:hypothetical protein